MLKAAGYAGETVTMLIATESGGDSLAQAFEHGWVGHRRLRRIIL